jgi:hypothetical protein
VTDVDLTAGERAAAAEAAELSDPQRRALRVLADGHTNRRPVFVSNRTTSPGDRILKVARPTVDSLVSRGIARFHSRWELRVELAAYGRAVAQELDL